MLLCCRPTYQSMCAVVDRDTAELADGVEHAVWIRVERPHWRRGQRRVHARTRRCCLSKQKGEEQCTHEQRGHAMVCVRWCLRTLAWTTVGMIKAGGVQQCKRETYLGCRRSERSVLRVGGGVSENFGICIAGCWRAMMMDGCEGEAAPRRLHVCG